MSYDSIDFDPPSTWILPLFVDLEGTHCREDVGVVILVLRGPKRYFAFGDPGPDLTTISLFVKVF